MQSAQFQLHAEFEQRHWWFVARRRILKRLVGALLPASPDSLVIDIGCGTGANIAALAGDYRTIGIDTSAEAIALARDRFPAVQFVHGFAPADLGDSIREAKLVLMMDVLEHVPDDFALFSSVAAALSPGALLVATVPANEHLWNQHDESFGHYRRYDRQRFARLWEGLPVQPQLVSHFNARLYPLIRTIRSVNRLRGKTAGAAGTDFQIPPRPLNWLLENCFAGEGGALVNSLQRQRPAYGNGVSLLAVLRRDPGDLEVRTKPLSIPADVHDPADAACAH